MPEHPEIIRLREEYSRRDSTQKEFGITKSLSNDKLFMFQQRTRNLLSLFRDLGIQNFSSSRLLELGCGDGGVLFEYLSNGFAPNNLFGVDLLMNRLVNGKKRFSILPFTCADGQRLPYSDAIFDLAIQYTAFSSILDSEMRNNMAREMMRVLRKPNGSIIWYDFWVNPSNPNTRGMKISEIRKLFPKARINFRKITLAPPITKVLIPISWIAALLVEKIRMFNSHYLAIIRPRFEL